MTDTTDGYRFDGVLPVKRAREQLLEYDDREIHHIELKVTPKGESTDD